MEFQIMWVEVTKTWYLGCKSYKRWKWALPTPQSFIYCIRRQCSLDKHMISKYSCSLAPWVFIWSSQLFTKFLDDNLYLWMWRPLKLGSLGSMGAMSKSSRKLYVLVVHGWFMPTYWELNPGKVHKLSILHNLAKHSKSHNFFGTAHSCKSWMEVVLTSSPT